MAEVLCIGKAALDLIFPETMLPEFGRSRPCGNYVVHPGGTAANVAIALAKLGIDTCLMCPWPGSNDPLDVLFRSTFDERIGQIGNLSLHKVEDSEGKAPITLVFVDPRADKERTFVHYRGKNQPWSMSRVREELAMNEKDDDLLEGVQVCFFGGLGEVPDFVDAGEDAGILLDMLKRRTVKVAADVVSVDRLKDEVWREAMGTIWPKIDYFMPNKEEARTISGEADPWRYFESTRLRFLLLKDGSNGVSLYPRCGEKAPVVGRVDVRDTTGAGDTWCAGFLAHLIRNDFTDMHAAARFGVVTASRFCIGELGATEGIPVYEEVEKAMVEWYGDCDC